VLLQGETSVGKTSLVRHLAQLTGTKCVRVNNHEHTDVQEYLGTYVTDPSTGHLRFSDGKNKHTHANTDNLTLFFFDSLNYIKYTHFLFSGPLVQAMKLGHWIILDELNLAPSDVLEALNRVRNGSLHWFYVLQCFVVSKLFFKLPIDDLIMILSMFVIFCSIYSHLRLRFTDSSGNMYSLLIS